MSSVAEAEGHPHSCQTHVLGDAVIPQRLRSLRKVNARPASPALSERCAKRHCTAEQVMEPTETAIAEMLLGLSHSPSSTPRGSEVSTEDEECLPLGPQRRRMASKTGAPAAVARPAVEFEKAKSEDSTMEGYSCKVIPAGKCSKSPKKLPGRCKCGKRVSAAHPPCKSELMLLCERFCERCVQLAANGEPARIHLNDCAVALSVPRRRLYDITIVYEAVEVVKRTGKLSYVWCGTANLPKLAEQLKREEEEGRPVVDRKGNSLVHQHSERQTTHSLWTLSRKFIRLLLTLKGPIQLSDAADFLIGNHASAKRQQTQVTVERRLYDIGSILATLNLIQRTYVEGKRQPAFSWNWGWQAGNPAQAATSTGSCPPAGSPSPTKPEPVRLPMLGFATPPATAYELPPVSFQELNISLPPAWSMPAPLQVALHSFTASPATTLSTTGKDSCLAASLAPAQLAPFAPLVLPPKLSGPISLQFPVQPQCGKDPPSFAQFISATALPQA